LTTLTFSGSGSSSAESVGKGKIKVLKTDKFVGSSEVCVIGKLVEGAVSKKMSVSGKDGSQVISVESKYGDGFCMREGAQVVLMVSGISKDEYGAGAEIVFEKSFMQEAARPKGRIIIA
jgi:hypothetical protein